MEKEESRQLLATIFSFLLVWRYKDQKNNGKENLNVSPNFCATWFFSLKAFRTLNHPPCLKQWLCLGGADFYPLRWPFPEPVQCKNPPPSVLGNVYDFNYNFVDASFPVSSALSELLLLGFRGLVLHVSPYFSSRWIFLEGFLSFTF